MRRKCQATFFSVLGVNAIAGRTFLPADDAPGQPAQAVVSEALWERRYGRASWVDRPHDHGIGSAGRSRRRAAGQLSIRREGRHLAARRSRGTAIHIDSESRRRIATFTYSLSSAGCGSDVSLPEAQAELDVISARLAREYPATNKGWGTALDPLQSALVGHTQRMLVLLLAAVALMLVIASVNVANLMLVRTKAREVELAMRSALGASPGRVIRQILCESMVLAACGGALGLALAAWGVSALVRLAPEGLPRLEEIAVNGRIARVCDRRDSSCGVWLWFVAGVAGIARALTTALQGSVRSTSGRGSRRSQLLLVSSELAIAQVLLVAAGLLLASFVRLTSLNPGFDPRDLVAVDVSLPGSKYRDAAARIRFHEDVLERLSATPGMRSVATAMQAPMRPTITRGVWIEGRPAPPPGESQSHGFLDGERTIFRDDGHTPAARTSPHSRRQPPIAGRRGDQ